MWLRYWGKIVSDYSAMQWPCDEGFHVPSVDEWQEVYDIWGILGGWSTDWTNFGITLKLPFAGDRPRTNGNSSYQGTFAVYWSSTAYNNSNAYDLYFSPTGITPKDKDGYSNAFSIRAFKDVSVTPTNSWLKLYWTSIEAWWIFWSANDWLISLSSNWTTWVTISDKNLWATAVYNNWDTLSEANCGKYFQWGNNYWFPRTWTITISSTQANASNYWPWNYYSSSIFITRTSSPYNWSNARNDNLRWWVTGVQQRPTPIVRRYYWWKMKTSYSAMRWPCPVGFHVPLTSESTTLVTALSDLGMDTSNWADISQYLKIPYAWYRYYTTGDISQQGVAWWYWASDWYSDSNYRLGNCVLFTSTVLYANNNQYRTLGLPVRPYKDTPVIPDSWWTQLYAWTWNSWVFHNSTLWLISISSDWTNWITIADKNLWATTVYNNWDTLSESNCWWYFQRWNNYMFPFTWNITTTYWYVDATNYWPWNYYSDSTFIKSTLSTRDWCYPANNDLRWRTTWPQQTPVEILKTYYWNTLIWEKP